MSWLTNLRPKLRALVHKKDVPDNLWRKCTSCKQMIFHRDLDDNLYVCTHCGHHMRLPVMERIKLLFDDGSWKSLPAPTVKADPLNFRDRKRYTDRLREARDNTRQKDAMQLAAGKIGGQNAVVAAFDFDFMAGSMGTAVGEALVVGAQEAVKRKAAYIVVTASGGARMQEGILSLMQMPRSTVGVRMVKEAGLPYIVLLADPTTGGVSASFAMLGDVTLAEPGALIGFAGQRVIQETIRQELPEGFQRAEYLQDHGMVDMVVSRADLPATLGNLLGLLMSAKKSPNGTSEKAAA